MTDEAVLDATALHEAGHVLACMEWSVPFRYVTLRPRESGLDGLVRFGGLSRVPPSSLMRVLVAGPLSEMLVLGTGAAEADGAFCSDLDDLAELMHDEFGRGKKASAARRDAAIDVRRLFEGRQAELLGLALLLQRRLTLHEAEVREAIVHIRSLDVKLDLL